jgi:uncharacterized membrane protein
VLVRALLAAVVLGLMGQPAHAALNLCNRTSYILYAATAAPVSGTAGEKAWRVKGWTRITPGACVAALPGRLMGQTYLVHARSSMAHSGPGRAWGGDHALCVRDGDFTLTEKRGEKQQDHVRQCSGGFPLGFAAIATGGRADWTMTFDQKPPIDSLARAELAGVRRLLQDDGYKVGPIAGPPDKATGDALTAYRKTLPPDADNAALFTALEDQARGRVVPAGVTACNGGPVTLLVALGQSGQNKPATTRGWWTVAPDACARLQTTPLTDKGLAILARTKDGRTLKGGPLQLCVTGQAFQINDAGRACAARGFETAGFAPVPTHGAAGVIVRLGAPPRTAPGQTTMSK